jgi:hypothetical protein
LSPPHAISLKAATIAQWLSYVEFDTVDSFAGVRSEGLLPIAGKSAAKSRPMAAAMRAKSASGTRRNPKRNAAPQCVLLRMNESLDQWLDRRIPRRQVIDAQPEWRESLVVAVPPDRRRRRERGQWQ